MPSWKVHRKWDKEMLRDQYDEETSNAILKMIDMPRKAGFELSEHDWNHSERQIDALIVELDQKYKTYGLLVGILHFLLDDLRDQLKKEYLSIKEEGVRGTVYNPRTGKRMPKSAKRRKEAFDEMKRGEIEITKELENRLVNYIEEGWGKVEDPLGEEVKEFLKEKCGSKTPTKFVLKNINQILNDISDDVTTKK